MWCLIVLILVLPLFGLLLSSLVPGYGIPLNAATATLDNYRFVLFEHASARRAFFNSFALSLGTAAFAVLVAVPVAYLVAWSGKKWVKYLNLAVELPYALPGVVLAIASLLLFLKPIPLTGIQLYNTIWIILYAYLARFLVLALRPTISAAITRSTGRSRRRRASAARACSPACAPSSSRLSRRRRWPAACSSS